VSGRKRRGNTPGPFAQIPLEVLESDAHKTLNYSARAVLVCLASQFNGVANGVQRLTPNVCETHGLSYSQAKRDTYELQRRGLIEIVNQGGRHPAPPSMYALAWRGITHRDNTLLDRAEPAPNKWVTWKPDDNSTQRIPRGHSAKSAEKWFRHSANSVSPPQVHSAESANILESGVGARRSGSAP
jgi:hypothetical protein